MPSLRPLIVIPGDDPLQIQDSPHLARLAPFGDVALHRDRPLDDAEKVRRARDAIVDTPALVEALPEAIRRDAPRRRPTSGEGS